MIPGVTASGARASDPHWTSVLAMLHLDGVNGSSSIVDSKGGKWTAAEGAQISTAQYRAGGASLRLPGYISRTYTDAYNWWQGDITIEMFVRLAAWPSAGNLLGNMDPSSPTNYWSFGVNSDGRPEFYYYTGALNYVTGATSVPLGAWVHLVMQMTAGLVSVGHDGVLDGSAPISGSPQSSGATRLVCGRVNGVGADGYVDELRITKGVARYAPSYVVPASPFPS